MKIKCVILDDEAENLKSLQQVIDNIDDVEVVRSFTDATTFTEGIKQISFDMCIMDNHLPDGKGVDLAKSLKGKKIIFVSAHDFSAYDAFDSNAIDVIRKPVTTERLEKAIKKCRDKIINDKGYVFLKTTEGKTKFSLDDIICIETDEINSEYKWIMCSNGDKTKTNKITFPDLLQKLPAERFFELNKQCIVNIIFIKSFGKDDTVIFNHMVKVKGREVPFSRQGNEKLMTLIKEALGV